MGTLPRRDTGDLGDQDQTPTKLSLIVGNNLRRLRRKRAISLEALAHLSGVSRAMLGQIETGKSAPTINLLGRVAQALDVSIGHLISTPEVTGTVILPRDRCAAVTSSDGRFVSRAMFPWGEPQTAEVYELTLAPGHRETAQPSPANARKTLVVTTGTIEVQIGSDSPVRLSAGDGILFNADVAHNFHNPGSEAAKSFLVVARRDG